MSDNNAQPRWAYEDYQGAEEDFTEWMRQIIKKEIFADLLKKVQGDAGAEARVNAEIEHMVMSRTKACTGLTERAFILQLWEAQRDGWYHYLPAELDTIEELLATLADSAEEGTSEYYDYSFLVETVLPLLRQIGAKPEDVWGLPNNTSKARAAVPAIRHVLREEQAEGGEELSDDGKETIMEIARGVTGKMNVRDFRKEMKKVMGKRINAPKTINIEKYHMPDGSRWYLAKAPTKAHAKAIEIGLRGITNEVNVLDAFALAKQVANLIKR